MTLREKITTTQLLPNQLGIFYLGQVGFLLKYQETYTLIDGFLSDYVDQNASDSAVRWERLFAPPIHGEDLDFVDYVFCTHNHGDHMDPWTLRAIHSVNTHAKYLVSEALRSSMLACGIPDDRICGLKTDITYTLDEEKNISFRAVPSAHEELHPAGIDCYFETGFRFCFGDISLYHAGDCCVYDGLEDRILGTDIEMLPINGRDYYRNQNDIIGNMDSSEALTLAKHTAAKLVIPTHFDLYAVNGVNPAYFVDCQQKINPQQQYHIFMPGELYIYMN